MRKQRYSIVKANISDYPEIINVWESAVRTTHHFLKPEDFEYYKWMGPTKCLPALNLYVLRIEKTIIGFIGVSGRHLEVLFVEADSIGKGYDIERMVLAVNMLDMFCQARALQTKNKM